MSGGTAVTMGGAERWARRLFDALDAGDIEGLASLLDSDARFRFGNGPEVLGREAVLEAARGFLQAVAATWHEITACCGDPDAFVAETRVRYRRLDGREVVLPAATSVRLRGGRARSVQVFVDATPVFAPPAGSA